MLAFSIEPMSARRQRQELANLRAMEEEEERLYMHGAGATPSMGLSQFRGGAKKSGRRRRRAQYYDEEMEGGFLGALAGLAARALPSLISRVAPAVSRVIPGLAARAAPAVSRASTAIVPFVSRAAPSITSIVPRATGAISRFVPSSVRSVVPAVQRAVAPVASRLGSVGINATNLGRAATLASIAVPAAQYLRSRPSTTATGADSQFYDENGGLPGGMPAPAPAPTTSRRRAVGPVITDQIVGSGRGDGRSARAAIVRDVMRQTGMSLPEASSYVKQNGLY
jgi:hypothetical protein